MYDFSISVLRSFFLKCLGFPVEMYLVICQEVFILAPSILGVF